MKMNNKPSSTHYGLQIRDVPPETPAQTQGLRRGDRLTRINGHEIHDTIDVRFHGSEAVLTLEIERNAEQFTISLKKEIDEDLGLEFETPPYRTCKNHCLFCFVHQMPRGLRRSLYVKDDDYRLSFLHGSYITLTNCREADYERIFRQRLSPLYISVHATDDRVRRKILGNPDAPPILPAIRRLAAEGIRMHVQVVLCRGTNDEKVLEDTVQDLMHLYPNVQSVAVVPVGLTRFRKGLPPIAPMDLSSAEHLLHFLHNRQERCRKIFGETWIFPSDEFYLTAGLPFPPLDAYDSLPQLENGVGMTPLLLQEAGGAIEDLPPCRTDQKITIGTGTLAYPVLERLLTKAAKQTGASFDLVAIPNHFFGRTVTVSGLLTGSDLLKTFSGRSAGKTIFLPSNMLKHDEMSLLDGLCAAQVEKRLHCRLRFVAASAEGLLAPFRET